MSLGQGVIDIVDCRPFFQNDVFLNVILSNMFQLNLIWKMDLVFSKHKIAINLVCNQYKIAKTNFTPRPNVTKKNTIFLSNLVFVKYKIK